MNSTAHSGRTPALASLVVTVAAIAALAGCSAAAGSASSSAPSSDPAVSSSSSSPAEAEASPSPVAATLGTSAQTPTLAITVTDVVDGAAPKATQPIEPGTHWATAAVKECATTDARPARLALTLADGSQALETQQWPDGLPTPLIPTGEGMPAGQCISGLVYFAVPDGATVTEVVALGSSTSPQVSWPVLRGKETH